jgi:hypothetical protein
MLRLKLKRWWLARQQRAIAADMQAVIDSRAMLTDHEAHLMRTASRLAVQEIDLNIVSRRANRDRATS